MVSSKLGQPVYRALVTPPLPPLQLYWWTEEVPLMLNWPRSNDTCSVRWWGIVTLWWPPSQRGPYACLHDEGRLCHTIDRDLWSHSTHTRSRTCSWEVLQQSQLIELGMLLPSTAGVCLNTTLFLQLCTVSLQQLNAPEHHGYYHHNSVRSDCISDCTLLCCCNSWPRYVNICMLGSTTLIPLLKHFIILHSHAY